jgi:hypothetical protein
MAIQPGIHVGPYEVLSAIGAGGMGEVYRARDPKLGRDVAIKVLPEAFARDAERMARFQREAKVLASLSHPNIATIYGLEDSDSTRALVMELVEGPTLADRIKAGPIPVDDAIRIARQIADALEYAHERGIIHRDPKPANVKVTNDDAVKVLDFGLAKALEADPSSIDISTSPTISRMATMQGVLLGTAAYMSPEQAKAKTVDRRADIWAFGCVLYEMLTGKMAFSGDAVTDTLAAVIRAEPDWSQLPAATPMRLRVLLQRCLQKDAKQRLRDIGDARISIDEVLSGAPEAASGFPADMPTWRLALPWGLTAALAIAFAISAWALWRGATKPAPTARAAVGRYASEFALSGAAFGEAIWLVDFSRGSSTRFTFGSAPAQGAVWSSDGSRIIFSSNHGGSSDLYEKPASGATDEVLLLKSGEDKVPGSWSRDGRFLLYAAHDPKKKTSLWVLPLAGDRKPFPFLRSNFNQAVGRFSPDGRWVAYMSDESGRYEIYVRSFSLDAAGTPSATAGKWMISTGGGIGPRWRGDGRELYYLAPDGKLMTVEVATNPVFRVGVPKSLFQTPVFTTDFSSWDLTADGKRFLFLAPAAQSAQAPFTVVLNWQAALKK